VIQRDQLVPIRGFATPGAEVTVSFGGQSRVTVADDYHNWLVTLDPLPASATGRDLTAAANNDRTATVRDVVVGDVWFFTGGTALGGLISKVPAMPLLREFRIKTNARRFRTPRTRRMEIGGGRYSSHWITADFADPKAGITAAAYHFASQVQEKGVPIGIVNVNADNPPLTWISYASLQTAIGFEAERDEQNLGHPNTDSCKAAVAQYIETVKQYNREIVSMKAAGKEIPQKMAISAPRFPQPYFNQWSNDTETATHTYNFCISPNTPYAVSGVVWVPGAKSIGKDVARYAPALKAYAESLAETYGQAKVRFLFAQPSAALVKGVAKPSIEGALAVEFSKWPKMNDIATKLGVLAAGGARE
jgi:sialate O-acetylesterase